MSWLSGFSETTSPKSFSILRISNFVKPPKGNLKKFNCSFVVLKRK